MATEKRAGERIPINTLSGPGPAAREPAEVRVKIVDISVPFSAITTLVIQVAAGLIMLAIPLWLVIALLMALTARR